ncbi:ACR COG1723 YagE family protein [Nitzschia inconspicua]|uniref:ACR COG1723 YagE family protein n=1 Tax=Nitzschia inconspicua TaxID=303405 RepID=A0A9K3PKP3_9STRA|nr:ACR COG1723 YagE family protein [Nitzschia inconspicua]
MFSVGNATRRSANALVRRRPLNVQPFPTESTISCQRHVLSPNYRQCNTYAGKLRPFFLHNTSSSAGKSFHFSFLKYSAYTTTIRLISASTPNPENTPPEKTKSRPLLRYQFQRKPTFPGTKSTTVIEPHIRTRPFRHFRGPTGGSPATLRRPPPTTKRVVLNNPQHHIKTPHVSLTEHPHEEGGSYPVHAYHVAQSIDLAKVISKVLATKSVRKMMERLSIVVQLEPQAEDTAARFVAVFRFGSVVFFNVPPRERADLLWEIKHHALSPVLSGNEQKEKFCVHVQPNLNHPDSAVGTPDDSAAAEDEETEPEIVTGDYCVVQELNMKAVDVISNVMAQSVALDSYNDMVDELLVDFERINKAVVVDGNLAALHREKMFRAIALNNAIFIEMVSKVGIKDRIDTAWNLSQYEEVSQGLIEEFDIEERFEHIEFKLNLIQQNAKFFLEVLAHQKSNSLEWIIIVLIMFECVLMCMEMSGVGEPFFKYLGTFTPTIFG